MATITHEAEVQRQHMRVRIPISCEIGGLTLDVVDWSIGGIGLQGGSRQLHPGDVFPVRLLFPFSQFGLNLEFEAQVRYVHTGQDRVGLQFVNVTARQAAMLRFIIDAYVSGEIVGAGDLLEVAARRNEAKPRPAPADLPGGRRTAGGLAKRAVQVLAATAASLALLGFVGVSLYDRLFVIPAKSAMITADLVTIPATIGGSVGFVFDGQQVGRGEPLAAIEGVDGKTTMVNSPCDCVVQSKFVLAGDYVGAGAPMVSLRRSETRPYVAAFISQDDALRIIDGASVVVQLADGRKIEQNSARLVPVSGSLPTSDVLKVVVDLGDTIDASSIGQPVRVSFETSWKNSVSRIAGWLS